MREIHYQWNPPGSPPTRVEVWRGITVEGPNGRREENMLYVVETTPQCTRLFFTKPITLTNGESLSIGSAFAEEIG